MSDLDLGIIGNCAFSALIDRRGCIVWSCLPRFDGDPVFCRLLNGKGGHGYYAVELDGLATSEQAYIGNTAILSTKLFDAAGAGVEIIDFAPRFSERGRRFRPTVIVRILRPTAGTPRVCIRLRPAFDYGAGVPGITHGSNHIRYVGEGLVLRLTTNAPLSYIMQETPFLLEQPVTLILGPDETLQSPVSETGREFFERTHDYWRTWSRSLTTPFEWQEAVIRSAITLKLCSFEETGGIVAAVTTSIPEARNSGRNWDYRYCWLRDAYFVVRTLNQVAAHQTMEDYLRYLNNIVASSVNDHIQPVYGVGLEQRLDERTVASLEGYGGMSPVRVGNQAFEQLQHDVYGDVIMATTPAFFDIRLFHPAGIDAFQRLEPLGERAFSLHDKPDAGPWELRASARVHTYSSLMCWAACDRLACIAGHLGLPSRAEHWRARAEEVRKTILSRAWNEQVGAFVASFDGSDLDASALLMEEIGFIDPADPRFVSTIAAVEQHLRRSCHVFRYAGADDFGVPQNAFVVCTFWYISALSALGRTEEARELFEHMLGCRNHLGLLSEDIDPETNELWGNFPQTYSHVGLINCAMRLSKRWEDAL